MASKRKSRKPAQAAAPSRERLVFVPDEPRSFVYVDEEDEFEVPPIPYALALAERQLSVRFALRMSPAPFDAAETNA